MYQDGVDIHVAKESESAVSRDDMKDFRAPSSLLAFALLASCATAPPIDATKLPAAPVETQTSSYRGRPKIGSFGFGPGQTGEDLVLIMCAGRMHGALELSSRNDT